VCAPESRLTVRKRVRKEKTSPVLVGRKEREKELLNSISHLMAGTRVQLKTASYMHRPSF
jgi:hypothetical protein